jgi:cytochrome b involved in lipid metabolism
MSLIGVKRKKRLTQKEIKDFALWALKNEVYDKYTCLKIKEMYEEEKGVVLTESTVRLQKNRWILINGEVYDVNKPHTFPE